MLAAAAAAAAAAAGGSASGSSASKATLNSSSSIAVDGSKSSTLPGPAGNHAGLDDSSTTGNNAHSSSSSSSISCDPLLMMNCLAPVPFTRLLGLVIKLFAQFNLAVLQDVQSPAAHSMPYAVPFNSFNFTVQLYNMLMSVYWLRPQLQQLLLPGDPRKAAAALQGLQEQHQQLQQALGSALWRLNKAADIITDLSSSQQQQQQQQQQDTRSSSSGCQVNDSGCAARLQELASTQHTVPLCNDDIHPARHEHGVALTPAQAAALVGAELPQQLQQFGSALWSALPQPRCCNNAACANLGSISEAKLVPAKGNRCSKCKAAR
jgi:hypothetical protein